ncbi:MAG: efflux RND transporter periplasmic adaptor subunit [Polyangiaceae bacterium]
MSATRNAPLARVVATCFAVVVLVGVVGCKRPPPPPEGKGPAPAVPSKKEGSAEAEPGHDELPTRVTLSEEVIAAAKIHTSPVTKAVLVPTLDLPGEVTSDPDRTARVASPVPGRLKDVRFKEGSAVKKGDVLATVAIPELGRVRGSLLATEAKATAARSNAERLAGLAEKGLAAKQDVASAKAEADALAAESAALKEQLVALGAGGNGAEVVLRAPVGGIVVGRDAVVGQPVSTEQTIATIADLDEVWFLGRVFEKDLGRLRLGARAEIVVNAYADQRFEGVVEYLGKQIDPVARTVTARIRLRNRDEILRLGLFGSARIATDDPSKRPPVLVVPRNALTEVGGKSVVFVRNGTDFDKHEVVAGESALGKVEIVSGLREGELVVDEGVFTLKSAVLKKTFAEEE